MKVIEIPGAAINTKLVVIGLGNFDGIHLGHRVLIDKVIDISRKTRHLSGILLFRQHTNELMQSGKREYLTSLEDKLTILNSMGIDLVFLTDFDEQLKAMSPKRFIDYMLIDSIHASDVVVGIDYRFGYRAMGDLEFLRDYGGKTGLAVHEIEDIRLNGIRVSSSLIKTEIRHGHISSANRMLGYDYTIRGTVIHGNARGRELGFPTANLSMEFEYVLPEDGVYFTRSNIDGRDYYGLTNIGYNPTFEGSERRVETHLHDFDSLIYGKTMQVSFIEFLRSDIKFTDKTALVYQMQLDKIKMIELMGLQKI